MNSDQNPVQHRALCPICGKLATTETSWINDMGVTEAAFLCPGSPQRHSWTTKWYEPKGAAA